MSIIISPKVRLVITDAFSSTTNSFLRSEEFDQSIWTKVESTITLNDITSPDSTTTADKLVENTEVSTSHYVQQTQVLVTDIQYTWSVYAKPAERTRIRLRTGAAGGARIIFDLSGAGEATVDVGGSDSFGIISFTDGWYRCWITFTETSGQNRGHQVYLDNGTTSSYTGDGSSGVHIWGGQFVEDSIPGDYIKTIDSPVTANYPIDDIEYNHNKATEISILKGPTLSRGSTTLITEASRVSSTSNKVSKVMGTGFTGVKFNFKTYLKPVADGPNVTSPEKLLWESLAATNVVDTASTSTVAFTAGNVNKLRELYFYLIFEDDTYYRISRGVVQSVNLDLDINGIAIASWEVVGLDLDFFEQHNLITFSEQFDHANWDLGGTPVTTPNSTVAPDGTTTADTLQDDDAVNFENYRQNFSTFVIGSTYTASVFLLKDAVGRATRFPLLRLQFSGSTSEINDLTVDTLTGEFLLNTVDPLAVGVVVTADDTLWWRISMSAKSQDLLNTSVRMQINPALGEGTGWDSDPTSTGSIIVWGAQATKTDSMVSYFKTEATVIQPLTGIPKDLTDSIFIRNKLSTINLTIAATTYDLAIVSASIKIINSVILSNRVRVGEINNPSGHYTGDRSTNVELSFYLNDKLNGSSALLNNLLGLNTLAGVNTLTNATISIGGTTNALKIDVLMPTSKIQIKNPTVGILNTVAISLYPQESVLGLGDEISLVYNN